MLGTRLWNQKHISNFTFISKYFMFLDIIENELNIIGRYFPKKSESTFFQCIFQSKKSKMCLESDERSDFDYE